MRLGQTILKSVMLAATMSLGGCSVYEDNFTPRGKLFKSVSGFYGLTSECDHNALYDESSDASLRPKLVVADYYQIYDLGCRLTEVEIDGRGFILKPPPFNCKDSAQNESITPFGIRVEAIGKYTVKFQEIGSDKAPVTVYRCGSKIN